MNRRIISLVATVIAVLLFVFVTVAAELNDVVLSLQINNPVMEINGEFCEIDEGRGTKPVIVNGRTLIPIRAVIESFGGTVTWDGAEKSTFISLDGDTLKLTTDSLTAYHNGKAKILDVAPTIINGRTMLPIRFISESLNLGISWDENTKSVYIIRDTLTDKEYESLKRIIPEYAGYPYVVLNDNVPFFEEYEIIKSPFEYYSKLDFLGRCDVCFSTVTEELMPDEPRKSISSVTPTGWINKTYGIVSGGYLYNRCHLIGFQLTGENANKRNLITGTRYLNMDGMLDIENKVADYIKTTGNGVVYRSTPVFDGNNLLASGVLLEAWSWEDNGDGISFCVYCYNVQPGIYIDYATGASSDYGYIPKEESSENHPVTETGIYRTPTGKKYHYSMSCGGANSFPVTLDEAVLAGLTPCKKCVE